MMLDFEPGEAAQVHFGRGPVIDDPEFGRVTTWIFVMTLAWSRHTYAEVVLDQTPGFDRGPPPGSISSEVTA